MTSAENQELNVVRQNAGGILKRRFHSKNVSNDICPHYTGQITSHFIFVFEVNSCKAITWIGDEFPRRLCDPLPPVILFYHVSLQPTSGKKTQQSQGVGSHRVDVRIRYPT